MDPSKLPKPNVSPEQGNSKAEESSLVQSPQLQDLPTAGAPVPAPIASPINRGRSPLEINRRARLFGLIASVLVVIVTMAAVGFYLSRGRSMPTKAAVQKQLSDVDLQKLAQSNIGYDGSNQSLTFHSPAAFDKDLKVGGTASVKDLIVTGSFTHANSNVDKPGDTLFKGQVTAKGLMKVEGNLIVDGSSTFNGAATFNSNASFKGSASFGGALSADSISVKSASIGGLTFGHILTNGSTPTGSLAVGAGGGSFLISGNDTSGSVVVTAGGGSHTGDLVNVSFKIPYTSTPHVNLTPVGITTAGVAYYVTRSVTGFTIGMLSPIPGVQYAFDYLVTQ